MREQEPRVEGEWGSDEALLSARALLRRAARSELPILILGETGTGKELAARAVHDWSERARAAFVAVNCGAIPDPLAESELFGHGRGAFTGAHGAREGLLGVAAGGTLFLDEVGDASPLLQTKLLRVLSTGAFRRVGETRERNANLRVVAATHRDLEGEVRAGRFRSDLWYRLAAVQVSLPPLRARGGDVLRLAAGFLAARVPGARFDGASRRALRAHDWPGNVRELEWAVAHASLFAEPGGEVGTEGLPARLLRARAPVLPRERTGSPASGALKRELEALEQQRVREAMELSGGRRARAARLLGLSRQGLQNKLARIERREDAWPRRS